MTLSFQFGTVGSPLGTPKKPGGSVGAIEFSKSIGLEYAGTRLGAVGARDRGHLRGDQGKGRRAGCVLERPRAVFHQPERAG